MYHRFSEIARPGYTSRASFSAQLDHLRKHYRVMSLAELIQCQDKGGQLPANTIVITIDDGYEDFYSIAFPLLKQSGLPATLFVTTGFVDGRLWLWPDKISWMLAQINDIKVSVSVGPIQLEPVILDPNARALYWQRVIDTLLTLPDVEKHRIIEGMADQLDLELPGEAPEQFRSCNWQQLGEMQQAGIEVGGHTVTHPSLGRVEEKQARAEIVLCGSALNKHLGPGIRTFCYPNGTIDDFTPRVERIVEEAGFIGAVTAFDDCNGVSSRFAMRRFPCGEDMFQFYKCVSGVQHLGNIARKKAIS